jgi:hypothetical protein
MNNEGLLFAMSLLAHESARGNLTPDGIEVLEMIDYAATYSGLSIMQAWRETLMAVDLAELDHLTLLIYVCRVELIEQFSDLGEIEENEQN